MPPLCKTIETTRRRAFRRTSQGRLRRRAPESPAMDAAQTRHEDNFGKPLDALYLSPPAGIRLPTWEGSRRKLAERQWSFSDGSFRCPLIPRDRGESAATGKERSGLEGDAVSPAPSCSRRKPSSGRCGNFLWNGSPLQISQACKMLLRSKVRRSAMTL